MLLVVGALALLLGILGLVSGKSTDPYEARNGIAMVYATVYDNQGNSESGWGHRLGCWETGQTHSVYCDKWACGAKSIYLSQTGFDAVWREIRVYFSAAENDFVKAKVVYFSPFNEKDIAILELPSETHKAHGADITQFGHRKHRQYGLCAGIPGGFRKTTGFCNV